MPNTLTSRLTNELNFFSYRVKQLSALYRNFFKSTNNENINDLLNLNLNPSNTDEDNEMSLKDCLDDFLIEVNKRENRNMTSQMIFIYSFTLFNATLRNHVYYLYSAYPDKLKNKNSYSVSDKDLLQMDKLEDLRNILISREVGNFENKKFSEKNKYFINKLGLDLSQVPQDLIQKIKDRIELRNQLVHNQGTEMPFPLADEDKPYQSHLSIVPPTVILRNLNDIYEFSHILNREIIRKYG